MRSAFFHWKRLATLSCCALWGGFAFQIFRIVMGESGRRGLEDDLLWFIPVTIQETAGGGGGVLRFIFHLKDEYGIPSLNFFMWLFVRMFGLHVERYAIVLLGMHFFNSILLGLLLRRGIRMSRLASLFASLMFLTYFPHFHAYVWSISVQHLAAISGVLLVLWLYFETENAREAGHPSGGWYAATLAAGFLSSFARISVLIAPVCIATDIALGVRDRARTAARYGRWLPLLILYAVYPAFEVAAGASGNILSGLLPSLASLGHPTVVGGGLFLTVAVALVSVRALLRLPATPAAARNLGLPLLAGAFAGGIFLSYFPVWSRPIMNAIGIYLVPWKAVVSDQLFARWHPFTLSFRTPAGFPSITGIFLAAGSILLLAGFSVWAWYRRPRALVFVAWYFFTVPYLSRYGSSLPSRYYIYLSPLVAVILTAIFFEGGTSLFLRARARWARPVLAGLFGALVVALASTQLWALRKTLFLTRLPACFWSYDYVRTSELIREDLARHGARGRLPSVSGMEGVPFLMPDYQLNMSTFVAPAWRYAEHHPFKYVYGVSAGLPPQAARDIPIDPAGDGGSYRIVGLDVCDAQGVSLDPFIREFEESLSLLNRKQYRESLRLMRAATARGPFCVRFALGGRPPDAFREASEKSLLEALKLCWGGARDPKVRYVMRMIKGELTRYARALVLRSYLEDRLGELSEEGVDIRAVRSVVGFNESIPDAVLEGIESQEERKELLRFLDDWIASEKAPPSRGN